MNYKFNPLLVTKMIILIFRKVKIVTCEFVIVIILIAIIFLNDENNHFHD